MAVAQIGQQIGELHQRADQLTFDNKRAARADQREGQKIAIEQQRADAETMLCHPSARWDRKQDENRRNDCGGADREAVPAC